MTKTKTKRIRTFPAMYCGSGCKPGKYYIYDTSLRSFYKKGFKTLEAAKQARQAEIDYFIQSMQVDTGPNLEIFYRHS